MRGYILIILPSLFFNFGCSSPEKNVSNDKKNNELVSLEFIRKDKQERVSRDGHKVIPSPEIQKENKELSTLELGSEIENKIKEILDAKQIGLNLIDDSFQGNLIYPKALKKSELLSQGLKLWTDGDQLEVVTKIDFLSSIRAISKVFDKGINIKTVDVLQNGQTIKSRHLVDFLSYNREAHAVLHCEWIKSSGEGLKLFSLIREDFNEIASERDRLFEDQTEKILGGNPNFDIQFNQSISNWAGQITRVGDLAMTGHNGLSIGDANGDGRDDFYVCEAGSLPNRLYLQQEDGTAIDVSAESGLDWYEDSRSSLFVDLDNDGDQDLVVATIAMIVFCENNGEGVFRARGGFPNAQYPFSISASDYDLDGKLDIYVCVYGEGDIESNSRGFGDRIPVPFHSASNGGNNVLIKNHGEFRFSDATQETGLNYQNNRWSFAASWEDFDKDGDPDLYVANDFGSNSMYRNDGGVFVDIAKDLGIDDPGAGMSVSWGDLNNDSNFDLYVGNMFSSAGLRISAVDSFASHQDKSVVTAMRYFAEGNSLFIGESKNFEIWPKDFPVSMGRWSWSSGFADLNNDGWEDLVVSNGYITGWREKPDL